MVVAYNVTFATVASGVYHRSLIYANENLHYVSPCKICCNESDESENVLSLILKLTFLLISV